MRDVGRDLGPWPRDAVQYGMRQRDNVCLIVCLPASHVMALVKTLISFLFLSSLEFFPLCYLLGFEFEFFFLGRISRGTSIVIVALETRMGER